MRIIIEGTHQVIFVPGHVRLDYCRVVSEVDDNKGNGEGGSKEGGEQHVAHPPPPPQNVHGEDADHKELHVTSQEPRQY